MNCTDCQDLLLDLAYGELAPDQAAAVQSHAQGCAQCGLEYAKLRGARQAVVPLLTALREEEQPGAGFDDALLAAAREAVRQQAARPALAAPTPAVPDLPAHAKVLSLDAARLKRRGWLRAAVGVSIAAAAGLALVVGSSQKGLPVKLAEEPAPAAAKTAPTPPSSIAQAVAQPEESSKRTPQSSPPQGSPALAERVAGAPGEVARPDDRAAAEGKVAVAAQQAQQKKEQAPGRALADKQVSAALQKDGAPAGAPSRKSKKAARDDAALLAFDDGGFAGGGGLGALSGAAGASSGAGPAANIGGARGALSGEAAKSDAPAAVDRPTRVVALAPPSVAQSRSKGVESAPAHGDSSLREPKERREAMAAPPPAAAAPQPASAAPAKAARATVAAAAAPESEASTQSRVSPLAIAEIHEQQAAASADPAAAARLWLRAGRLHAQAGDTEGAATDYSRAVERFAAARLPVDAQQAFALLSALAPAQPAALAKARAALEGAAALERAMKAAKQARPAESDAGKSSDQR